MSTLSRRTLVTGASAAGLTLALPRVAGAQDVAYAAFRIARARPGEPRRPGITLPGGYEFVPGERYHVASRAEYYTFVQGPPHADGIEVAVHWPGVAVAAVVHMDTRLALRRRAGSGRAARS